MHSNFLAILFALASALTIAWGTVVRHQIAEQAGYEESPTSVLHSIMRLRWWAGLSLSFLGYALQIIALAFGTLLVVQPILVLSLMFTLPLSAKVNGRRISKSETAWAALLTTAVAILVVSGRPTAGITDPPLQRWLIASGIGLVVFVLLYVWSSVSLRGDGTGVLNRTDRALILGAITGGIMGYVAVLSKSVTNIAGDLGVFALLTRWELYALIGLAIIGTAIQQASFNAGELKNSLPAMTVVEPIVAFILGYTILGEKFQVSGYQWIYMAVTIIVMVVVTVVLSRKSVKQ